MKDPIQKSKRRHALKEIDRKWAPKLKAGKEMAESLRHTLAKKMPHDNKYDLDKERSERGYGKRAKY